MASDNDFLSKMQESVLSGKTGLTPGIAIPKNARLLDIDNVDNIAPISTAESIFLEKIHNITDFTDNDVMSEIQFPDNLDPNVAASFLNMVHAAPMIPTNDSRMSDISYMAAYIFPANTNVIKNFIDKYETAEDLNGDPKLIQLYASLIHGKKKINVNEWDKEKSAGFMLVLRDSYNVNRFFFNMFENTRDKINFLYSLCSDNLRIGKLSAIEEKNEEIFRHFVLQNIEQIENALTVIDQEMMIDALIHNIVADKNIMARKWNEFNVTLLGLLKQSKPLSMAVVLDNGLHADFFTLDKNKHYRIMHSVNVSKVKEPIDLSKVSINSDFVCAHAKTPIKLPKSINGFFDCSYCCNGFINADTRLPNGATYIDFSGTIKSIKELTSLTLPKSVQEILLLPSTINAVLKNSDSRAAFEEFTKKYPHVQIRDSKRKLWLQDMVLKTTQQPAEQKPKVVEVKTTVTKPQNKTPTKTDDWLTRKEVLSLLERDTQFTDITGLDRLVKRATNSCVDVKVENRMFDGNIVSCIHIDCLTTIKQSVSQIIEEDSKRAKPKEKAIVKQETPVKKQTKKQIKPVRIYKYVPKQIWKDICNSCGNSFQLLYSVLDDINKVNNSYDTQTATDAPIQYIDKNGNWQCITNTEYKGTKAATQWISKRDNRRIVWTINSGVMVAIAFFEDHVNNAKSIINYREALSNAKKGLLMDGRTVINKELVKSDDFLNVSDLLKQYKKPDTKQEVKPETKPQEKQTVSEPVQQPIEDQTQPIVARKKRPRIRTQVEVKGLDAEISVFIAGLDEEIKKLSIKMCKQKDNPKLQLEVLQQIEHYIQEKINLQRD